MTVPTYDQFIEPLLRFMASRPKGVPAREAHDAAALALGISEADRQELLASGAQLIYKNRAGWAHDRLKRAGLSSSPRRGFWQLTGQGLTFVAGHAQPMTAQEIEQLAIGYMDVRLRA
ncbi:MAG: winged helix-turn-helix domain-containing protein, partial [Polaromonas sp.]